MPGGAPSPGRACLGRAPGLARHRPQRTRVTVRLPQMRVMHIPAKHQATWRDRPGLQAARYNLREDRAYLLHKQGFPARRVSLLSARSPNAPRRCGVGPVLPKNAVACSRTSNLSSISVLARRMKLTGP
ncbi:hypothetical protein JOE52_005369 [Bradyrhizobium canariense]|nr:hypothetical protein [Bradyrhizobium canariense]